MNPTIEINRLSHRFGRQLVLNDLTLKVPAGSIYGFLGRNGAGKTTCIRLLVGLLTPQKGSLALLGENPITWSSSLSRRVGYMGDVGFLPKIMTGNGLISWTRALYPSWDKALEERLADTFQLNLKKLISSLSLGQQKQLAFLLAVASRPSVLILDEPAANLDTVARRQLLEVIATLALEQETTVFFSSHVLSDIERIADRVGILSKGNLLVDESLDELKESIRKVRFFWDRPEPPPVEFSESYRVKQGRGETLITLRVKDEAMLKGAARDAGCSWEAHGLNLEDLFVELTGEE